MLSRSPIVLILSLQLAVIYGYLYILFTTFVFVFEGQYHFQAGPAGLAYLGLGIGFLISLIVNGLTSDYIAKKEAKNGELKPESRLAPMIFGVLLIPAGLIWYGWTAQYKVHWIVPIIGTSLIGMGVNSVWIPIQSYLIDAFGIYSASALAANTVVRSVFGVVLPLAGQPLYDKLGLGWGNTLLAFIALATAPLTWLIMKLAASRLGRVRLMAAPLGSPLSLTSEQAETLFSSSSICQEGTIKSKNALSLVNIHGEAYSKYHPESVDALETLLKDSGAVPMLQLVLVPIDNNGQRVPINNHVFRRLVTEHLGIDPCVLHFIARKYDGFHRIDGTTSTSYVMATSTYMLIWKYDRQRGSTTGLFFERRVRGFCKSIPDLLKRFSSYSRSPGLLAFLACLATCEFLDVEIGNREVHHIQYLEEVTAFGPDRLDVPEHRHETEKIMYWLRLTADVHINLANKLRITSMISVIMENILGEYDQNSPLAGKGNDLRPAVLVLASRVRAFDSYAIYLKERANQLSSVIFTLLTHEDAAVSTDMAKSSHELARHSTYIAECAKRDSSGMKAITIITMAFLPATFFATLFAVPSLDWNGTTIITGNFWVYWAFTLPTTALVFLLWISLTYNKAELGLLNMQTQKPVRESILEIDDDSWIIGDRLLLSRQSVVPSSTHFWSDGRGAFFVVCEGTPPLPQTRPLSPASQIQLVHDAGDRNAAWRIGEAFLKVQDLDPSTVNRTREHITLNYLHDPANNATPTFPTPGVLFHKEYDNRYYLFTSRVPGDTLEKAWPNMSEANKQACVRQVVNICKELAQIKNDKICGVDGRDLSEAWIIPPQAPERYSHEDLLPYCKEVGMDSGDFVLHHCDMGPTNVIVDQTDDCRVGIIDWEVTGYVPKEWIRTKFCVCWAMDFDYPGEDIQKSKDWRQRVQLLLGQEGFAEVGAAWKNRFSERHPSTIRYECGGPSREKVQERRDKVEDEKVGNRSIYRKSRVASNRVNWLKKRHDTM
ncbi:hypothetical protein O1611_g5198 [Lasiodiplodia mahajangana]|uniref:Uncharacterized protein n=1 Tax=Lasiodiplodia mahajangana TaxID=1108764 RepID=A0ACC2JLN8_9PEZI|nr:hypothetical protein O1611_g5198 [Lasiodiplodia mahajangana]